MGGFKTISIIVAANIKGLEAGLGKANKSIAGFASKAARVGSLLSFGVTAPITALGKQAFDTFSNFENEMTKVVAVTGATVSEFKMLKAEAKRLGATTQFTAQQFANLQLVLGRKGFDPTAIKNMEGVIADLALATGEDLTLAADTVASSINAFGLESEDASRVANTLASAAANSSMQLSTFATAFGHAGSSAKAVGVDIESLSAMMGVLMDNGIKASKAGTGLRKVFMKLNQEGIPFESILNRLASGQMTLNQAQKIVGTTAANQLLILSKNRDKISELTDEYKTNTTRLKEMSDLMGSTTFAKVKKLQSAIEGLKLEFGAIIADAVMPMIKFFTHLAQKFSQLDVTTKRITIAVLAFLAALGPLALIVGGLGGMFVAGLSAMLPFLIAFAKFALITAAVIFVVDKLIIVLGTLFQAFVDNHTALKERFKNLASNIGNFFIEMFNDTVNFLKKAAKKLGFNIFKEFKPTKKFEIIPDDELTKFNKLSDSFDKINKKYSSFKSNLGKQIKDSLSFDFSLGEGGVEDFNPLEKIAIELPHLNTWADSFVSKLDIIKEQLLALKETMINMAASFSESWATTVGTMIADGKNLGQSMADAFKQTMKQFVALIIKALILAALISVIFPGRAAAGASFIGNFKNLVSGGQAFQGFANGGRPPLGKVSVVGEQGPELFVPDQAGTVIPNHALGGGNAIPDVRISGNDLLIVFDKAQRIKNRR